MAYDYNDILCNCKQVSYGQVENVVLDEKSITDVLDVFKDVQEVTKCSTGCGGCYDKIVGVISDIMYQR